MLPIGKGELVKQGSNVLIMTLGPLCNTVENLLKKLNSENINPTLYDVRFLKPFDEECFINLASNHNTIITIEDGTEKGGLFSEIAESLEKNNLSNRLLHIAIPDEFITHGDIPNLYKEVGFDEDSISDVIKTAWITNEIH